MKILLMERSREVADRIAGNLSDLGYDYCFVESIEQIKQLMISKKYDCLVLDASCSAPFSTSIISEIRSISKHTGLIITSEKDCFEDRIAALNTGADDFLTKPFEPSELAARILALNRRMVLNHKNVLVYKEIQIDLQAKAVSVNGSPLNLTKKELELLMYFLNHKNSVIKKDNLITFLSGHLHDFTSSTDIIYSHIKNLKKKMSEAGCNMYLKTIYGIGYKWEE